MWIFILILPRMNLLLKMKAVQHEDSRREESKNRVHRSWTILAGISQSWLKRINWIRSSDEKKKSNGSLRFSVDAKRTIRFLSENRELEKLLSSKDWHCGFTPKKSLEPSLTSGLSCSIWRLWSPARNTGGSLKNA